MKIVIIIVDFMKNILMEFKSSVVLPLIACGKNHPYSQGLWPNTSKSILLLEKLTFSSFKI